MRYTGKISNIKSESKSITEFYGIDQSKAGADGYLFTSENLETDGSALRVRGKRATLKTTQNVQGIFSDGAIAVVAGGRLYYGGLEVSGLYLSDGEKMLCRLGKYLLIFPEGVYCDLSNMSDHGNMNVANSAQSASVSCVDASLNAISYGVSEKEPDGASEGDHCVFAQGEGYVMKRYDGTRWVDTECFVKIESVGIGASLKAGDTVKVFGTGICDGVHTLYAAASGMVCFKGVLPSAETVGAIGVKREVPIFDHVCVCGSRLYGVRRGYDRDGRLVCRMYASAENDPFTFFKEGGGTYADVDISGAFTGMCDMSGTALAFGESDIVEGYIKSGALTPAAVRSFGAESGAHKSICSFSGAVYYKSRAGICRYDGSYPKVVSDGISFYGKGGNGCPAAVYNGKYHIKLTENNLESAIYIYDTQKKSWMKQDDPGVTDMVKRGEALYMQLEEGELILADFLSCDEDEKGYLTDGSEPELENDVSWSFETQTIGGESLKATRPVSLCVRMEKAAGCEVRLGVVYDGVSTSVQELAAVTVECCGSVCVPMRIKRCDSFRIRVSGVGQCRISGIEVTYREGGVSCAWKQ